MFIRKSKIENQVPIGELPKGKIMIEMTGDDTPESIWVAKDEKNKVMYLLNHALMFYPIPSWGMELPLTEDRVNLHKYRGDSFDETDFTVCAETYESLKEYIGEDDSFDTDKYFANQNKQSEEEKSEEEK